MVWNISTTLLFFFFSYSLLLLKATGIQIDQDVVTEYNEGFKLRNKYRYIVLYYNQSTQSISLEKTAGPDATYSDFLNELPENDCRYVIYKFDYETQDDGKRSKVVFFLWSPETSKIKSKMIYAGTKDTLKKALVGIQIEVQGTDKSEVDEQLVLDKCQTISK